MKPQVKVKPQRNRLSDHDQRILLDAVQVLEDGGIILYPTDTVIGLGCDATNEKAVEKIFEIKKRSKAKSLLILLDDDKKLNRYVEEIPEVAWDILDNANQPITLIYPQGKNLAPNVCAQDGSIGVRIVKDNNFLIQLLRKFKKPIVSTSANKSNQKACYSMNQIDEDIKNNVDYIAQIPTEGEAKVPSSIIKIGLHGEVKIIR